MSPDDRQSPYRPPVSPGSPQGGGFAQIMKGCGIFLIVLVVIVLLLFGTCTLLMHR